MSQASTHTSTVLPASEAAIVTRNDRTELSLVLPNLPEDEALSDAALYLAACLLRWQEDPDFVRRQVDWLAGQARHGDDPG
jgi:hypothetical protein